MEKRGKEDRGWEKKRKDSGIKGAFSEFSKEGRKRHPEAKNSGKDIGPCESVLTRQVSGIVGKERA